MVTPRLTLDWWPAGQLRRRPVSRVVVCGRRLNPPLYAQVLNFPRIEIPLSGCYVNEIEQGDRTGQARLVPGDALYAAPHCWNLPEWQPGLKLLSFTFARNQIGISLLSYRGRGFQNVESKKFSLPRQLTGPVPHLLQALADLQAAGNPSAPYADLVRSVVWCLEELLRQPQIPTTGKALTLLEDIRTYLQSHYQYEISRDSVAEHFGITPNHLSRLFQSHGNLTFSKYLTLVRLDRAKHLLQNYNLKLDDIAARCGYHDTPYFCHVFKHMTKTTPAAYRLKAQQRGVPKPDSVD